MFLTTDNLESWLFHEVKRRFDNLNFLGCPEMDVVQEQRMVHYSRTGQWPDFSSKSFHWTSHIATTVGNAYENTGAALPYTDIFLLKLGFSNAWNLTDVGRGKVSPVSSINFTGIAGVEFALDLNEKWLSTHNVTLPLSTDYIGHIKLSVNESNEFIKRLD
jgi:hypothetical protein